MILSKIFYSKYNENIVAYWRSTCGTSGTDAALVAGLSSVTFDGNGFLLGTVMFFQSSPSGAIKAINVPTLTSPSEIWKGLICIDK